jgi:hypothetical protein
MAGAALVVPASPADVPPNGSGSAGTFSRPCKYADRGCSYRSRSGSKGGALSAMLNHSYLCLFRPGAPPRPVWTPSARTLRRWTAKQRRAEGLPPRRRPNGSARLPASKRQRVSRLRPPPVPAQVPAPPITPVATEAPVYLAAPAARASEPGVPSARTFDGVPLVLSLPEVGEATRPRWPATIASVEVPCPLGCGAKAPFCRMAQHVRSRRHGWPQGAWARGNSVYDETKRTAVRLRAEARREG